MAARRGILLTKAGKVARRNKLGRLLYEKLSVPELTQDVSIKAKK